MNDLTDILLISPTNDKLGIFSKFSFKSVPLALGILAGYLIKNGYKPEIVDEEIVKIDKKFIKQKLQEMDSPKIFGISCMTTNFKQTFYIAKLIKEIDNSAIIIAGGIHPTVAHEEMLKTNYIDFVIQAEGEKPLVELLNKLKNSDSDYSKINNLIYSSEGNITVNPKEKNLIDVNEVPMFPYYLFDKKVYDLGFVLTSRGCPFNCIFCSQRAITSGSYRYRNNNLVIEELDYLINKENQTTIGFFDDCFTANKQRVFELCKMIKERGLDKKCSFGAQTRGDSVTKELLLEMKSAGFKALSFGVEVSSNHLMKVINKREKVEDNVNAIKMAKELSFRVEATFIFGFPEETFEDRINCLKLAKDLNIDVARFNMATPYPGTELYNIALAQNRLYKEKYWSNFNSVGIVASNIFKNYKIPYYPEGIKPIDLAGEVFLANFLFFINLKNLRKLLNFEKKHSAKWFNWPKNAFLNPVTIFHFCFLILNVILKTLYYLTFSKESKKFFIKGFYIKD
jgi:anaerobic magnesium-protoporphyrin IX monomethyl ester cyclase